MTSHVCDYCRATGVDPEKRSVWRRSPSRCETCRGSGVGERETVRPFLPIRECGDCAGTGIREAARCPVCLGRGAGETAPMLERLRVALQAVSVRCAKYNHRSWDREQGLACHKSGSAPACVVCQFAAPSAPNGGGNG